MRSLLLLVVFGVTLLELAVCLPVAQTDNLERSEDNDIQDTRRLLGILKRLHGAREYGTSTHDAEARSDDGEELEKRMARIPIVPYKRRLPFVPYKRGRAPIVPYKRRAPYVPYKRADQDLSQASLVKSFLSAPEEKQQDSRTDYDSYLKAIPTIWPYKYNEIDDGREDMTKLEEKAQDDYQERILSALKDIWNNAYISD